MDGRIINEILVKPAKKATETVRKETITTIARTEWGTYELRLERTVMGKYSYVNYASVKRTSGVAK
jgi:hypothetical protein